jgi:hypothetical protein
MRESGAPRTSENPPEIAPSGLLRAVCSLLSASCRLKLKNTEFPVLRLTRILRNRMASLGGALTSS